MPLPIKIDIDAEPTDFPTLTNLHGLADGNLWVSGAFSDVPPSHQFVRISYELILSSLPEDGDRIDFWIARGDGAASNPIWDGGIPETESEISVAADIAAALAGLKDPDHTHAWQSSLGTTLKGVFDYWDAGHEWALVIRVVGENLADSGNMVRYNYGTPAIDTDTAISVQVQKTGPYVLRTLQSIVDEMEVTPGHVGADRTGASNASPAIQDMFDAAAETGALIRISHGKYRLDDPITATYAGSLTNIDIKGYNVRGDGRNVAVFDLNHDGDAFHIYGDPAGGSALHLHSVWSGFTINGLGTREGTAFRIEAAAFFELNDVLGFNLDRMINGTDVLSAAFFRMHMMASNYGVYFERVGVSRPNAISFYNCIASGCREYAYRLIEPTTVDWFGGSVEGSGKFGDDTLRWGIKTENAGVIGGGINIKGVHFEGTHGNADIWFTQGTATCNYTVDGCTLQKTLPTEYPEFNIRFDQGSGAADITANIINNSFEGFNGYTPSASRPAIRVFSTDGNFSINAWPNDFQFPDEIPTFAHNPNLAWGVINGTLSSPITPTKAYNITSVTKNSTGNYTINLRDSGSSTVKTPSVIMNAHGSVRVLSTSATQVQIECVNLSGTPTDATFYFSVKD